MQIPPEPWADSILVRVKVLWLLSNGGADGTCLSPSCLPCLGNLRKQSPHIPITISDLSPASDLLVGALPKKPADSEQRSQVLLWGVGSPPQLFLRDHLLQVETPEETKDSSASSSEYSLRTGNTDIPLCLLEVRILRPS